MKRKIILKDEVCISDFKKALSFISEEIKSVVVKDNELEVDFEDNCNIESLVEKIEKLSLKFIIVKDKNKIWYENIHHCNYMSDLINNQELFFKFNDGIYGLKGKAAFLFSFFEKQFKKIGLQIGGIEREYPVLLPVDKYVKTGYLNKSPQYAIFCCNVYENINELEGMEKNVIKKNILSHLKEPKLALSPSACFHTYLELENTIIPRNGVITFTQSVFRNEGRLNYNEIGRLQDYHVREIVYIGDNEFVHSTRQKIMIAASDIIKNLDLCGTIEKAYDPFIIPKFQKYKKIQLIDTSKYELRLKITEEQSISVASFNLHGAAFTYPFNISVNGCDNPVTGCVGFGIERWVIAFLSQYGDNIDQWPNDVRKAFMQSL